MDSSAPNILQGIAVVLVGAICFGTVYVPTKRCGRQNNVLFTQWIMSLGSLPVGFAIYLAAGSARLNLMSIIGGTIWTVANTTAHLVVDTLGLAVALLLWSSISTLTGWAAGRFGLFGLKQKLPEHSGLNMAGLGILLIGGACFAFVKRREGRHEHEDCSFHIPQLGIGKKNEKKKTMTTTTVDYGLQEVGKKEMVQLEDGMLTSIFKKAWAKWQRIISVLLALLAGFFYAASVIPVLYIQDHPERFPDEAHNSGLAFILSYCFGVFLASTAIFVFYALAKGNQPMICPTAILPSMISGGIWCCATCCLFLANDLLTQTVTYPVLITIPGCVATAWSLVYFREIKMNRRNTLLILIAFCLIFTGATFVFLSKLKL